MSAARVASTLRRIGLDEVVSYRNPQVVDRYLKDFGGSRREAAAVFVALLQWLHVAPGP